MSNEPIFKVLVDVLLKCCKFVLWQIIDGSKWRLHFFHKINGAVVWLLLRQNVHIPLLKHIFEFLALGRNLMWTWLNMWWGENINKKWISFFMAAFMKAFAPTNKDLGHLGLFLPPRFPCCSKFCMHSSPCLFLVTWHTFFWFLPCMFLTKVWHSKALCCDVSKWRLFVC